MKCEKCGQQKIIASQGVIGFPGHHIAGSQIEYCGYCDKPPMIELIENHTASILHPNQALNSD